MPRLLRLTGKQVVEILQRLGFEVITIKGSHFQMRRLIDNQRQNVTVPVHGNEPLALGTLKSIYRQVATYISEAQAKTSFYSE